MFFLPRVAWGLISSTLDLAIFSQVLILYFVLVVCYAEFATELIQDY